MPYVCDVCGQRRPQHRPETCPLGNPADQIPVLERLRDEAWARVTAAWDQYDAVDRDLEARRRAATNGRPA